MPPKVIAITGSIGAGKSLVGRLLRERGYTVIDTDDVVHDLFENSTELRQAISERFGEAALTKGNVDRSKLGILVFDNTEARRDLERIVHPAVLKACDQMLNQLPSDSTVFMLVPLLFEAGIEQRYTEIWTVITDEATLRERLRQNRAMTDDQIEKRLAAQLSQQDKARRSHRVINNSSTISDTTAQLDQLLNQLHSSVT